jgi:hypothetical protein
MLHHVALVRTNVPSKHQFLQEPHSINIPEDGILHSHCHENLNLRTFNLNDDYFFVCNSRHLLVVHV